jgi:hypothetical protein
LGLKVGVSKGCGRDILYCDLFNRARCYCTWAVFYSDDRLDSASYALHGEESKAVTGLFPPRGRCEDCRV